MTTINAKATESLLDPSRLARRIARLLGLRYYNAEWWVWNRTCYQPLPTHELKAKVHILIKRVIDKNALVDRWGHIVPVTSYKVRETIAALSALTLVPGDKQMPLWLDGSERKMFAFTNGLVEVAELLNGPAVLEPHSSSYFNRIVLPFDYRPDTRAPRWEMFLDEVLQADHERIDLMQEILGYCLLPGNWLHKFFLFVGKGANGKSVTLKVIESLVGKENCSAVPLGMFGERFQLVPTVGKLVNLAPEADSGDAPRIGVLKQFTGGDTMSEDRKGTSPISFVASAKLIIAANSHPSFVDRSDGLWRRLVYVPFDISVAPANQDAHLVDKLKQELPGIFNWALLGYKRLLEQQLFTVPVLSKNAAEAYELESNSVRMFLLEEGFEEGGECDCIEVSQLYHHYAGWSKANGHAVLNGKNFGKELRRTFPKVTRVQKRVGGKRVTAYVGLARAADAPEPEYAARGYRPEAVGSPVGAPA